MQTLNWIRKRNPSNQAGAAFAFDRTATGIGHYILSEYYPGTCFVRRTVNVEICAEFGHRGLITFDLLTLK